MSDLPFNIPPIITTPQTVVPPLIVPALVRNVSTLAQQFYLQNVNIIAPTSPDYINPEADNTPDPQLYLSALGTKVLVDLTFKGKSYYDENGQYFSFSDIRLETVLVSVTQNKNIVKTQIQGRKGTIKEYIGQGDYSIQIDGILLGSNGNYPKLNVQELIYVINCPESIDVVSWFLQMFGIYSIVIDSGAQINQEEGQYSKQPFSIPCLSDDNSNLRYL
jgi:Domain of unknown function (DUF6046)